MWHVESIVAEYLTHTAKAQRFIKFNSKSAKSFFLTEQSFQTFIQSLKFKNYESESFI